VEFEKTASIRAPASRVWTMLLDPEVMGACVPGMESIEVVSDTEYVVSILVKLSFVSARFKVRTTIVEMREPAYLRSAGTGEDATVTSSLKMASEVFLADQADGVELRMKIKVEVFGRLGGFGLNIIKTKADRMWDEFVKNFAGRAEANVENVRENPREIPRQGG
jgi:carbon monoxide dehydrogenase subunit G